MSEQAEIEELERRIGNADQERAKRPFTPFVQNDGEPGPDMTILDAGRRLPPEIQTSLFGPAWPLIKSIAEGCAAPPDYPAIGYLAACASLVGMKRKVKPYRASDWREPCILWTAAVGDPSSRKSPALDAVTGPLRHIETDEAADYKTALDIWRAEDERARIEYAEWQKAVKAAAAEVLPTPPLPAKAQTPEKPQRRRTLIQDATPEAVAAILSGNPIGTLSFRDELSGWLQGFDRYAAGGREFWLEAYGGRPFRIDRKGSDEPLFIRHNAASVLGGIQPEKLAGLLQSPDDGLIPRFLWVWPDKVPYRRPTSPPDMGALTQIYRNLNSLEWGKDEAGEITPVTIPLSPDAEDTFAQWEQANSEVDQDTSGLVKSTIGKANGLVLRLALVGQFTRWAMQGGSEPQEIENDILEAAADFADYYVKPMAARVYGDAGLPKAERDAAILARYILKANLRVLNKRELKRSPHKSQLPTMREAKALDPAIDVLVDAGWLSFIGQRDDTHKGRRAAKYLVDPKVFGSVQ